MPGLHQTRFYLEFCTLLTALDQWLAPLGSDVGMFASSQLPSNFLVKSESGAMNKQHPRMTLNQKRKNTILTDVRVVEAQILVFTIVRPMEVRKEEIARRR